MRNTRKIGSLLAATALTVGTLAMTATTANAAAGDGILTGRVTQPGGAPLADVDVVLFEDTGSGFNDVAYARTDANGKYDLIAGPGATYHVGFSDDCGIYNFFVLGSPDGNPDTGSNVALTANADTEVSVQLTSLDSSPNTTPCNRVDPEIAGLPQVGVPMRVDTGVWAQAGITFTYQWYSDNTGDPIPGATSPVYVPVAQDIGDFIYVGVTGHLGAFTSTSYADPNDSIKRGDYVFATGPRVTGAPAVKATLRASLGNLVPGASVSIQWRRNGVPIAGATGRSYKVTSADKGKTVSAAIAYRTFGYNTVNRVVSTPFTVRNLAKEATSVKAGKRKATFKVGVSPKATNKLKGTITVRENGKKVKSVTIKSGSVTFTAKGLKKGKHVYTITYKGKKYANEKTVSVKVK